MLSLQTAWQSATDLNEFLAAHPHQRIETAAAIDFVFITGERLIFSGGKTFWS